MEILKIENLDKFYGSKNSLTQALHNINLTVNNGEILSIMGASGSGKSTLLNIIGSIDLKAVGKVYYNGKDMFKFSGKELTKYRQNEMAFIFQDYKLVDSLTAYENIALALNLIGDSNLDKVKTYGEFLNITEHLDKYPSELSGGQRQRVAIARALVKQPKILLCDEPTGALDSKSSSELMGYLIKINQELNTTILLVTHDPVVASKTNRVFYIKDGMNFTDLHRVKGMSDEEFYSSILTAQQGLFK